MEESAQEAARREMDAYVREAQGNRALYCAKLRYFGDEKKPRLDMRCQFLRDSLRNRSEA